MPAKATRQFAFRLSHDLILRLEDCERRIHETGLRLSRTDVVRLLLTYALDQSRGELGELIPPARGSPKATRTPPKNEGRPPPRRRGR